MMKRITIHEVTVKNGQEFTLDDEQRIVRVEPESDQNGWRWRVTYITESKYENSAGGAGASITESKDG